MLFAFLCQDKPGALQLRMDTRPEHVAWLNEINASGVLTFAGPFLDGDNKPNGSLVVVKAETLEEAQAISAADPYAKAGLFASVDIRPWNWVFNNPEA
ncbi:YciI-like protein [Rhizobium sp. FKL33]|uniref:YciI-like protein n=1 Tax=Rhizobium sp. FKL33 TaxID=2562307 RepID=UPI0010BFE55A|nr:YciI-like protein [Rhizobium sp. FKL33]